MAVRVVKAADPCANLRKLSSLQQCFAPESFCRSGYSSFARPYNVFFFSLSNSEVENAPFYVCIHLSFHSFTLKSLCEIIQFRLSQS